MRNAELQDGLRSHRPASGTTIARSIPHSAFRIPHSCDKFHKPPTWIPMATDSILRPGELKDILLKEIQAADLADVDLGRSEEHTSELQSLAYLVCRLLLEKKK